MQDFEYLCLGFRNLEIRSLGFEHRLRGFTFRALLGIGLRSQFIRVRI